MPLRVLVFAKRTTSPAIQVEYTSISLGKPAASNFTFNPPAGAKVAQVNTGSSDNASGNDAANESRVIGRGWLAVLDLPGRREPPLRPDGHRDFRRIIGLLQQPHAAIGPRGFDRPVWHCAVRAAPEDKLLSDDEWAQIAGDIMHSTGLAPYGQEDNAVRWVAARHGGDHIHIVAMLARQDGAAPSVE